MSDSMESQTVVEPLTEYCRTCGHAKESHNLDFRGAPEDAHKLYGHGEYVCQHMTGAKSGRSLHLRGVEQLGLKDLSRLRSTPVAPVGRNNGSNGCNVTEGIRTPTVTKPGRSAARAALRVRDHPYN